MYFCYPKQSNKAVARIVAALACRQLLPLTALQLSRIVHFMADDKHQSRPDHHSNGIRPGSTVELQNMATGERGWLQLVNPAQASYRHGRISLLSPLGSTLLGKTAETDITVQLLCHCLRLRVLTVLHVNHGKIRSL